MDSNDTDREKLQEQLNTEICKEKESWLFLFVQSLYKVVWRTLITFCYDNLKKFIKKVIKGTTMQI